MTVRKGTPKGEKLWETPKKDLKSSAEYVW